MKMPHTKFLLRCVCKIPNGLPVISTQTPTNADNQRWDILCWICCFGAVCPDWRCMCPRRPYPPDDTDPLTHNIEHESPTTPTATAAATRMATATATKAHPTPKSYMKHDLRKTPKSYRRKTIVFSTVCMTFFPSGPRFN